MPDSGASDDSRGKTISEGLFLTMKACVLSSPKTREAWRTMSPDMKKEWVLWNRDVRQAMILAAVRSNSSNNGTPQNGQSTMSSNG